MRRSTLAQQIEEMTATLSRPRYLRITASLLVHDESRTRSACPCCGSEWAIAADPLPAGDLIIDLSRGDRFTESDTTAEDWQELCGLAKHHELTIRCSRIQLPLLLDTSGRHIFASGSQRSGKTYCGLAWIALQWLRRGGFERRFWLVAPTLPRAFRLLQKLFIGDRETPPFIPKELAEYMPVTGRASDTRTRMVDGSIFELRYFEGDPGGAQLKSDDIVAGLCDEASHLSTTDSFNALEGRTMTHAGHLFFASTPRPESFLKELIVDPAIAFEALPATDEKKISGEHPGAGWIFRPMPYEDNPWNDRDRWAAKKKTLDFSSPSVQRDWTGAWVGSTGPFWVDYETMRHTFVNHERDFKDFGATFLGEMGLSNQFDITTRVVSRIFRGRNPHYKGMQATNKRYLLGTDVNCHPMSTVIMQITGDRDKPDDKDKWHYWILDVARTPYGNSFAHVNQLKSEFFGKILEPGESKPFDGIGVIIDAKAFGRDPTVHKFGGDPRGIAELFGRANMDVRAPEYKMTEKGSVPVPPGRWDSFSSVVRLLRENRIHVSQRASGVREAFAKQQDSGNGHEPQKNDPLDSAMDGMRYAIWATLRTRARDSDNES